MNLSARLTNKVTQDDITNISIISNGRMISAPVTALCVKSVELPNQSSEKDLIHKRNNELELIFSNKCDDRVKVIHSAYYSLMSMVLSIASTAVLVYWPQHNVIGSSTYWYECPIFLLFGWVPIAAANMVNTCHFMLGIGEWISLKKWVVLYLVGSLTILFLSSLVYASWAYFGEQIWPMPFHGFLYGVMSWNVMTLCFWFMYPIKWRNNSAVRKKLLYGILLINVMLVAALVYKGVLKSFQIVDENWHRPLVFVLILVREGYAFILSKIGQKIIGYGDLSAEIMATNAATSLHTIFIASNLGSMTTPFTSYLILGSDFMTNLYHCITILWYTRKSNELSNKKKVKAVLSLIFTEVIEFTIPAGYTIVMLMAYFGPNAEIIGNIKNSQWQYSAINDLDETLFWINMMFLVDFASVVICGIVLRIFCKMNILKMYLQTLNKVGYLLAIQQAALVSEVCI